MLSVHYKYTETEFVSVTVEEVDIFIDGLPDEVLSKERKLGLTPYRL